MLDTACLLDKIKMNFNITKDIQNMDDLELKELFMKPQDSQEIIRENNRVSHAPE